MVRAYIMVKAHTGDADRLREDVAALDGVRDVHIVAGDVDLIATIDVDTPGDVKEIAADEIRSINGVDTTQTYIAMD